MKLNNNDGNIYEWKCTVCGEVFEGTEPPEICPVCGVGPEMFVKMEEKEEVEVPKETKNNDGKLYKWECTVCGEVFEGAEPPEICPVCGVGAEMFAKVEDDSTDKLNEKEATLNKNDKIVIIGASGAGMGAAVEIRKRNKECELTIISKEDIKGYYRPQLSKLLSNEKVNIETMSIKNDEWFKDNNINLLLDKVVNKIDVQNKKVMLEDSSEINYTKLIIATGAEVFVPPFPGKDKQGVFTLRNAKDGRAIKEYSKGKKTGAVIGGGVLGLEIANELNNLGLEVTIVEVADRILPRQLDSDASKILEEIVKKADITFKKGAGTKEIVGDNNVKGILLDNGETVEAEVVVISTGVKANSKIAEGTGIEIKRAIVVNNKMETTVLDIYGCGDCVEYNGINYALWSEAIEQGKTAGINVAGGNYEYKTIIPSTTLKAFNSSIFSIGDVGSDPNVEYETYEEYDGINYKKIYAKNNILSGGILIGDISKTVVLIEGFEKSKNIEEIKEKIKS